MELSLFLDELISVGEAENIAVCVGRGDRIITEIYKSKNSKIDEFTKFDMASVTKILATTTLALIAIDRKIISADNKISEFFCCPDDKKDITVKNLLTHTMGIGHENLTDEKNNYDNIAEYILNLPLTIPVGSDVLYSCPAFILLGKILEKVFSKPLNELFNEMVALPLGMKYTSFLPKDGVFVNSNPEPQNMGVVNDYNCRHLGGVAGNAGVFSNMHDMKKFACTLSDSMDKLISQPTFELATKNYTPGMSEARGLGFAYVDESYTQTGKLFPCGAIGHCGHTGQSVFVDVRSGLYAIVLSDMTLSGVKKYNRDRYENVIINREKIHNKIFDYLCECGINDLPCKEEYNCESY